MPGSALNVNPLKRNRKLVPKRNNNLLWSAVILLLVVLSDQATKMLAVQYLTTKPSVEVIGNFFMLTLVYNKGGAMGTNFGSSIYYLVSSILILLIVLYYLYVNRTKRYLVYPLAFIAGGAIGNIIDRIRFGQVVDFIDIDFFDIPFLGIDRWWTFNIADAAISCSIVYLLIRVIIFHKSLPPETGSTK